MCYSILCGYENTVKKRLSAKNGFTERFEFAEIGSSVAVCLSLWSGWCEIAVASDGTPRYRQKFECSEKNIFGKIGWYRGSFMLPSLCCGREFFILWKFLENKRKTRHIYHLLLPFSKGNTFYERIA